MSTGGTGAGDGVPGPRGPVHLDVRNTTVRLACSFALDEAGWTQCLQAGPGVLRVADHLLDRPGAPAIEALVVDPTPAASRRAVEALTSGAARSVVPSTDPRALPLALDLLREGCGLVASVVVDAAGRYPDLNPRLERTLQLVLRGWSNRSIARALHQSEATAKRDVTELLRRFDAANRMALAATAIRLGLHPDGAR